MLASETLETINSADKTKLFFETPPDVAPQFVWKPTP